MATSARKPLISSIVLRPGRPGATACRAGTDRRCPTCAACRHATRCPGAFVPALLAVDQPPCLPDAYRLTSKDPGRARQISEIKLLRLPQNEPTFGSNKVFGLFKYMRVCQRPSEESKVHGRH